MVLFSPKQFPLKLSLKSPSPPAWSMLIHCLHSAVYKSSVTGKSSRSLQIGTLKSWDFQCQNPTKSSPSHPISVIQLIWRPVNKCALTILFNWNRCNCGFTWDPVFFWGIPQLILLIDLASTCLIWRGWILEMSAKHIKPSFQSKAIFMICNFV